MHLLRRDVLIATLISLVLATILAALLAQRFSRRLDRIVILLAASPPAKLSARVEEGNLDEISDVAHALDATASRLEQSFRTLEANRRELEALLDSMQEAVVARMLKDKSAGPTPSCSAYRQARCARGARWCTQFETRRCSLAWRARSPTARSTVAAQPRSHRDVFTRLAPLPPQAAARSPSCMTLPRSSAPKKPAAISSPTSSHELRTPLTSISGYVETLLDGDQSEKDTRDFLSIILKNATRVNRLTEDLLALASGGIRRLQAADPTCPCFDAGS